MKSRAAWVIAAVVATAGTGTSAAHAQPATPAAPATGTQAAPPAAPAPTAPTASPAPHDASREAGDRAEKPAKPTKPVNARFLLLSGDKKLKANDYAGALQDYQAADGATPSAESARGIAFCQEKLGNAPEAVAAYQRFLAAKPAGKKADIDAAQASVALLEKAPAKLHIDSSPPRAQVSIDGAPQPQPTPLDVELPSGSHVVHVSAEGKAAVDRTVTVTFGQKQELVVELEPLPVAPPPPPVQPPVADSPTPPAVTPPDNVMHRSKLPAYITGGLAVASAVVGTVFGAVALNDKSNFDKNPTSAGADTGENHALVCDMAFGVAITLAVTSAVLFFTADEPVAGATSKNESAAPTGVAEAMTGTKSPSATTRRSDAPTFGLAPVLTPHGGGAGALLRF